MNMSIANQARVFFAAAGVAAKYSRYLKTGSHRALRDAEKLAREVGAIDAGNRCPVLIAGVPSLHREWASGKGSEFFYSWLVRQASYKPGSFNQVA